MGEDALTERLADALGAMPEARNIFDYTDEATTWIDAPVEQIAERLAPVVAQVVREHTARARAEGARDALNAAELMADSDEYARLRAVPFSARHACPVDSCRLSAEEHHRLAYGLLAQNRDLRRRIEALELGRAAQHEDQR